MIPVRTETTHARYSPETKRQFKRRRAGRRGGKLVMLALAVALAAAMSKAGHGGDKAPAIPAQSRTAVVPPPSADTMRAFGSCLLEDEDAERLACYDRAMKLWYAEFKAQQAIKQRRPGG